MNRINKHQLFSLMIIFEIGSTTLFALGIKAKQDAWIAILVAMVIGLGFAWVYTELQKAFPEKNYIQIIVAILGKWLGLPLSMLYAIYWLWPTVRILRETSELIVLTYLPNTPLIVIICTFAATSIYVLSLGNQVFFRTTEILMPLMVIFIISIIILVIISGEANFNNFRPILGEGIMSAIKVAYPTITIFPFSFILILSMYWRYVDDKSAIRKITMLAVLFSGILLTIISIIYTAVLGAEYISISIIPFIILVKIINIAEFITNLDAIGVTVIFLGGFVMMSVFLNGVVMSLSTIFKIKKNNLFLIVVGTIVSWIAFAFEPSFTFHQWMYPYDTIYFHSLFLHIIPILLLLINLLKAKTDKR